MQHSRDVDTTVDPVLDGKFQRPVQGSLHRWRLVAVHFQIRVETCNAGERTIARHVEQQRLDVDPSQVRIDANGGRFACRIDDHRAVVFAVVQGRCDRFRDNLAAVRRNTEFGVLHFRPGDLQRADQQIALQFQFAQLCHR